MNRLLALALSLVFAAAASAQALQPPEVAAKVHPTVEEQRNLQAIPWEKISAHESELSDRWSRTSNSVPTGTSALASPVERISSRERADPS